MTLQFLVSLRWGNGEQKEGKDGDCEVDVCGVGHNRRAAPNTSGRRVLLERFRVEYSTARSTT